MSKHGTVLNPSNLNHSSYQDYLIGVHVLRTEKANNKTVKEFK